MARFLGTRRESLGLYFKSKNTVPISQCNNAFDISLVYNNASTFHHYKANLIIIIDYTQWNTDLIKRILLE